MSEHSAEKDACTCSPYFGSCDYSPDCPRHGATCVTDPYDNHDRRILEDADAGLIDAQIVVVRCPHRIGLAYQGSPAAGMEDDWLMRLPCPCNDRSEVVAVVEPVQSGCDCTELCEMGPTCPGGMLAGLPGSGCHRASVTSPEVGAP